MKPKSEILREAAEFVLYDKDDPLKQTVRNAVSWADLACSQVADCTNKQDDEINIEMHECGYELTLHEDYSYSVELMFLLFMALHYEDEENAQH